MSRPDNDYPYAVTVQQKSEILGIGIALQGLADDDTPYSEPYLSDIVEHIIGLTQELGFDVSDQIDVAQGFIADDHGQYEYAGPGDLSSHKSDIMAAYRRLTNLTLKHR